MLVHGRSEERVAAVLSELEQLTNREHLGSYVADLSSITEVHGLAAEVLDGEDELHVLVNNAGIGVVNLETGERDRQTSFDGHELRFAVNYLAGFALTHDLLDLLRSSIPSRIVNVASAGQWEIDFDDVMLEREYDPVRAYCQSKLAQILFTFDLTADLLGTGVIATCLHPATYMPTKMVPAAARSTLEEGIEATFRLVADPDAVSINGRYFGGLDEAEPDAQAEDPEARRKLRELSASLVWDQPGLG